jgi:capsular exopolysaccharide synthesis family protein
VVVEHSKTLKDYFDTLWRRKLIVVFAIVLTVSSAWYFSNRQEVLYRASTDVFVNPTAQLTGASGASADAQARFLATQAKLADSVTIARVALENAGMRGITPGKLLRDSTVAVDETSNVLTIYVVSPRKEVAVRLANAYGVATAEAAQAFARQNFERALAATGKSIRATNRQIEAARKVGPVPIGLLHQLDNLLKTREDLQQVQLTQPVLAKVSQQATSASQIQPNTRRNVLLGALLGTFLGMLLAFVRDSFDNRIRTSDELAAMLGLPLLARIPPDSRWRGSAKLAMLGDDAAKKGEPFRKLRVAMDLALLPAGATSVMVTSAIEEEGKSTTIGNLAVAFARAGRSVVLLDLDLRRPVLDKFFGLANHPGLTDVALGRTPLEDAVVVVDLGDPIGQGGASDRTQAARGSLKVLTTGETPPNPAEFLETEVVKGIISELATGADILLVDAPPLLPVSDAATISRRVDAMFAVVRPSRVRRQTVHELRRLLDLCPAAAIGFVVTGSDVEDDYSYGGYYQHASATRPLASNGDPGGKRRQADVIEERPRVG